MSPRIRFRSAAASLALAGSLWLAAGDQVVATAPHCPAPPPCSPDGNCMPNIPTWGWYPTRWRTFPGDEAKPTPTQAKGTGTSEEEERARDLRGPVLPQPEMESQTVAPPSSRQDSPADVPGVTTPAGETPAAEDPGEAPAEPAADPFGMIPHPAYPRDYAVQQAAADELSLPAAIDVPPAPALPPELTRPRASIDADAPPALPPGLQRFSSHAAPAPAIELAQPRGVNVPGAPVRRTSVAASAPAVYSDRRVTPASAAQPVGIQLVNPAAAAVEAPGADGLRQAIYYEASDQPVALPAVNP